MGLYAEVDIREWGFTDTTPYGYIYIDYGPAIRKFEDTFMSISRSLVPVDTGYLKSTLQARGTRGFGTFLIAEATAEYAEYVEYGTWKMKAQPFFEPAFEEACQAFYSEAQKIYKQAVIEEEEQVRKQIQDEVISEHSDFKDFIIQNLATMIASLIIGLIKAIFEAIFGDDDDY